jgi:hypothetical protein
MHTEYSCGELRAIFVSGEVDATANHTSAVTMYLTYIHTLRCICQIFKTAYILSLHGTWNIQIHFPMAPGGAIVSSVFSFLKEDMG